MIQHAEPEDAPLLDRDQDPDNKPVLFAAVDWTDEERLVAVTQIMRLAGLPDDNWSPGDKPGREVPEPDSLGG